jgi:6-pyruvoyltetrahydropterin/6-carboxytetrahydropterin synthase
LNALLIGLSLLLVGEGLFNSIGKFSFFLGKRGAKGGKGLRRAKQLPPFNHSIRKRKNMRISVYRKAHFNAAHRLNNPAWSAEKNREVFGLCNNDNYHGHNYEMEVKVTGEVDPQTGYLIDLKVLKDVIKTQIENRFDHKNLNLDTEEFKELNPTAEHICYVIWKILTEHLDDRYEIGVRLYETPRNFVEYPA